jgi:hypothetical protein
MILAIMTAKLVKSPKLEEPGTRKSACLWTSGFVLFYYFYSMKRTLVFLLGVFFISSCGNKNLSIKSYYFPYADFLTAKVYKYVNAKDSTQVQYWRFQTGTKNGDTVMTTGIYDGNLRLLTAYHNKITDEGSRLQLMFVNVGDSVSMYKCEVKKNESFNWEVKPNTPVLLSFSMKNDGGTESREVVSERNFEPKKQTLILNGQTYDCQVIKESTMINLVTNNRTRSEEQQRTSYFAKGVGLIQYETFYANGKTEMFQLKEIIVDKDEKMFLPENKDSNSIAQ